MLRGYGRVALEGPLLSEGEDMGAKQGDFTGFTIQATSNKDTVVSNLVFHLVQEPRCFERVLAGLLKTAEDKMATRIETAAVLSLWGLRSCRCNFETTEETAFREACAKG